MIHHFLPNPAIQNILIKKNAPFPQPQPQQPLEAKIRPDAPLPKPQVLEAKTEINPLEKAWKEDQEKFIREIHELKKLGASLTTKDLAYDPTSPESRDELKKAFKKPETDKDFGYLYYAPYQLEMTSLMKHRDDSKLAAEEQRKREEEALKLQLFSLKGLEFKKDDEDKSKKTEDPKKKPSSAFPIPGLPGGFPFKPVQDPPDSKKEPKTEEKISNPIEKLTPVEILDIKLGILAKYKDQGMNHPFIQVDRRDPAYRALPLKPSEADKKKQSWEPKALIRWHDSVSIRTITNEEVGSLNSDVIKPYEDKGNTPHFGLFGSTNAKQPRARVSFATDPLFGIKLVNEIPLTSLRPGFKDHPEKRIVVIQSNTEADPNGIVKKQNFPEILEDLKEKQKTSKTPVSDTRVVTTHDRQKILDSIQEAGDGIKPGETVTLVLAFHGEKNFNPKKLPPGLKDKNGNTDSYLIIGKNGGEALTHNEIKNAVNQLAAKGILVNIIFFNCHSGGGVSKAPPEIQQPWQLLRETTQFTA
ncbi:MAG: hypothetical protein K2X66_18960 [Cyanobacteria bacterium]|nr:hypothetical protein [Cyanobacteriota bacterium]